MVLRPFCIGLEVLVLNDRAHRPHRPAQPGNFPAQKHAGPTLCGEIGLSMVLNEKLGRTLLVMMPSSELGPLIPRKARSVNNIFDALLSATMEDRSKE